MSVEYGAAGFMEADKYVTRDRILLQKTPGSGVQFLVERIGPDDLYQLTVKVIAGYAAGKTEGIEYELILTETMALDLIEAMTGVVGHCRPIPDQGDS